MLANYSEDVTEKAKRIKLLILDVDGVLTDGRLVYGNYGDEIKNFDVNDGLGIYLVSQSGIKCIILTAKASKIVTKRAKELKIDNVYKGFHFKLDALKKIIRKYRVSNEEICFVGDDLIDIPVLKRVGLAVCPPNAIPEVKVVTDIITRRKGGRGAVREICDLLLKAQGTWDSVTKRYFE